MKTGLKPQRFLEKTQGRERPVSAQEIQLNKHNREITVNDNRRIRHSGNDMDATVAVIGRKRVNGRENRIKIDTL